MDFTFKTDLWRWTSRPSYLTFLTLPSDVEDQVLVMAGDLLRGWSSVRVDARIGTTTFRTSVFPISEANAYALPVKRSVRDAEGLHDGDVVTVSLRLVDF
jgi:hypothetical protein